MVERFSENANEKIELFSEKQRCPLEQTSISLIHRRHSFSGK